MATWQDTLHLLPRQRIIQLFSDIPVSINRDIFDSTDWWQSVAVVQKNGTVVVASIQAGTHKPVLVVNQQGIVSQAKATISAGVRDGKAFFEVSDVVFRK